MRSDEQANHNVNVANAGFSTFLDKLGRRLLDRPVWFVGLVLLALILLPVSVWLDLSHISSGSLSRQAGNLNSMISEIRSYYSRNVIARVKANKGKTIPAHNYENIDGGIPIPATLSIELGEVIGGRTNHVSYRFVSDKPFKGRSKHNLDEFEIWALEKFRSGAAVDGRVLKISGSLFAKKVRMAVPVIMGGSCVACHNSHPESPSKNWKVGDVRGIQAITIEERIAANLFSFKYLLTYLFFAGLLGLSFAILQWRQATQFANMNSELEEANSFLASISIKISKYLSPQVYKSIFRGERDAIIATQRKKLTIFFSDIKDFTITTERLQPEELTSLLNEYFSEMEKIAQDHGATVDKFMGDAILAFFGDPETQGAKEDALRCVKMAVAMQKRLEVLGRQWQRRGIEKPLRARIGINTGYCNVGNFGSNDRMDYTIIGAEANLAARLETIAEPGEIVISYETYCLVQDHVKASPLEPISLKGISREIVPYAVKNLLGKSHSSAEIIEVSSDHMQLFVNLNAIEEIERRTIENTLTSALETLKKSSEL